MTLEIYNTLTRQKEPFKTLEEGKVRMYVCGVTVYDSAHIGHAMSSLVFDTLRRYLEHRGYEVEYVQNFTDVDDKIIARANALGVSPHALADQYVREFLHQMRVLNIQEATVHPRATGEIPSIIKMVEGLIDAGHAYTSNGNVYFRVQTFDDYGKLSNRSLEGGQPGETATGKEDPLDFALWKAAKPGEPAWPSPWGEGRPGWHIECSAMALHHLGEQIDIHGGGMDLVFPHHENEIAQAEAYTGTKPFARYWVHNGLLQLGEEKMSKSLGNLVTISEFLEDHDPQSLRLFVLLSGYRRPVTYTDESIQAAERGLDRLRSALRPANPGSASRATTEEAVSALGAQAEATRRGFYEAMDDDFSTPQALAHLFDLVKAINTARDTRVAGEPFEQAQQTLVKLTGVLGFDLATKADEVQAAPFIELLIEVRNDLRAAQQWDLADKVRDDLARLGIRLEDTTNGTEWYIE